MEPEMTYEGSTDNICIIIIIIFFSIVIFSTVVGTITYIPVRTDTPSQLEQGFTKKQNKTNLTCFRPRTSSFPFSQEPHPIPQFKNTTYVYPSLVPPALKLSPKLQTLCLAAYQTPPCKCLHRHLRPINLKQNSGSLMQLDTNQPNSFLGLSPSVNP